MRVESSRPPVVQNADTKGKKDVFTKETEQNPVASTEKRQDVCQISPNWEQQVDWDKKLQDFLSQLKKVHPSLNIIVADIDRDDLQNFAADLGEGTHIILSSKFLKHMASSAEAFYKGKDLLERLAGSLSARWQEGTGLGAYIDEDSVTMWSAVHVLSPSKKGENPWDALDTGYETLIETMKRLQKEADERKEKGLVKVNDSMLKSPADVTRRLARSETVGAVKESLAQADRNIATLKLYLALGPQKDRAKIRVVIAALEKAIVRGTQKIKALNEEELLRARQKKAEREAKLRQAELIRHEREQKKAKRRLTESNQLMEADLWEYTASQQIQRRRSTESYRDLTTDYAVASAGAGDAGSISVSVDAGAFLSCEVTVSPSIENYL